MLNRILFAHFMVLVPISSSAADQDNLFDQRLREIERELHEQDAKIWQREVRQTQSSGTVYALGSDQDDAGGHHEENPSAWGSYEPGKGFTLARTPVGEVRWSAFTYARYLNQQALDDTYTDNFDRDFRLDLRNDMQLQKVTMYFKGWLFNPKFHYVLYTWTSNSNQGQSAQVVVAGNLGYKFSDRFDISAGIGGLPTTRSTLGTFPNWLRVDNRTIADEFFRGSYTSGIWANGEITEKSRYYVMVGNNLSQLGVDATQLDDKFNTTSTAVWWMPTTGEYGVGSGWGDFEHHERVATLFGAAFTRSSEDRQSQPDLNSFENTQIRLSDGTLLFQADPFDTGVPVDKATYKMASINGGFKYCGYSLDAEYYWRWIDDLHAPALLPVDDLYDHGFQLQASAMVVPKSLQLYLSGSKINGEYGDPWDLALGANLYPFKRREVRLNGQILYLKDSPVGYNSVPFIVGGNGIVFSLDLVLAF